MTHAETMKIEKGDDADEPYARDAFAAHVTFGLTTIDRRPTAYQAVRVIRRHFPYNRLVVVDQNAPTEEARAFYSETDVDVRFVDYDIGLSAARNLMFRECSTRYFFMLDDDVVELPAEEMLKSFYLLRADERILVVGGRYGKISRLAERQESRRINPPFNYFMFRRADAKFALFFDPEVIGDIPTPRYDRDESYRVCQIVENFALFDVEKYRRLGLAWDSKLKIVAEHTDFYLNLLENTKTEENALVISNPRLVAYDVDPVTDDTMEDYRRKRFRHSFRALYARKWSIGAEMHLGKWINVHWATGYTTVKWAELKAFGEKQKARYKQEGEENIRRYANYPIGNNRVSFIATTVDRFDAIQALALSIRSRFGGAVEILLGIQCGTLPAQFESFARAMGVVLVPMDYDTGLSAARNQLVERVETEYFVLCDDDFIIDADFHLGNAIRILDDEQDIAGVGGGYRDVLYDSTMQLHSFVDRHFTYQAVFDRNTGTLLRIPYYHLPAAACYDRERGALPVDILQNLAIFRTTSFGPSGLHWDDRMKITGEHLDFYVKNLLQGKRTFLFDPGFSVLHNRVHNAAYRQMRSRTAGIELFYKKWGVRYEIDSELGVRVPCQGERHWRRFLEA